MIKSRCRPVASSYSNDSSQVVKRDTLFRIITSSFPIFQSRRSLGNIWSDPVLRNAKPFGDRGAHFETGNDRAHDAKGYNNFSHQLDPLLRSTHPNESKASLLVDTGKADQRKRSQPDISVVARVALEVGAGSVASEGKLRRRWGRFSTCR